MKQFLIEWSENPTEQEILYKNSGLVRTLGTIFYYSPPLDDILRFSFNKVCNIKTKLTVGAKALSKHYQRNGYSKDIKCLKKSSEPHKFWNNPVGNEIEKNNLATKTLDYFLSVKFWKNIFILNKNKIIFEIRNKEYYGIRWKINDDIKFIGFVEPQILKSIK